MDDDAPPDPEDQPCHLWPENWTVWRLWCDLETQWRIGGMGGRTGLDYAAVLPLVDRGFKRRERREVFLLVQAMEDAALEELRLREQREQAQR